MSDRIKVHALDPTGGTPGQVPRINAAGDAFEIGDPAVTAGLLVPLTTTVGGVPELVWDENDNLVMTEVPA